MFCDLFTSFLHFIGFKNKKSIAIIKKSIEIIKETMKKKEETAIKTPMDPEEKNKQEKSQSHPDLLV